MISAKINLQLWEVAQYFIYLSYEFGLDSDLDDTSDMYDDLLEDIPESQWGNLHEIVVRKDNGLPLRVGETFVDADYDAYRIADIDFQEQVLDIQPIGSNLVRHNESFSEGLDFVFKNLKMVSSQEYYELLDIIWESKESQFMKIPNTRRVDFIDNKGQNLTNKNS